MMTTTWKFGDRQPEQVNDENISPEGMLRKKSMPKAEKDTRKVENIGKIIKKLCSGRLQHKLCDDLAPYLSIFIVNFAAEILYKQPIIITKKNHVYEKI